MDIHQRAEEKRALANSLIRAKIAELKSLNGFGSDWVEYRDITLYNFVFDNYSFHLDDSIAGLTNETLQNVINEKVTLGACEACGNREILVNGYCSEHIEDHNFCEDCGRCGRGDDFTWIQDNAYQDNAYCERCRDNNFHFCDSCDEYIREGEGCDCNDDEEEGRSFGSDEVKVTRFNNFKKGEVLQVNRGAGIELEFSKYSENDREEIKKLRGAYFFLTNDGSVNGAGKELVSGVMKGKLFEEKLKTYLKNVSVGVDKSCGFHIHVNTRDFRPKDVKHLFRTYQDLENIFFSLIPDSRKENRYCLRFDRIYRHVSDFKKQQTKTALEQKFYSETDKRRLNNLKKHKYNGLRYAWANFHSLFSHYNVEIRLHSGTADYTKIVHWIALNTSIVEYVKKYGRLEASGLREMLFKLLQKDLITESTFYFYVERYKELNNKLN